MAAIVGKIAAPLRKRGLDIVKSFQTEWYIYPQTITLFSTNFFGSITICYPIRGSFNFLSPRAGAPDFINAVASSAAGYIGEYI
jgi:hypothetical protein